MKNYRLTEDLENIQYNVGEPQETTDNANII